MRALVAVFPVLALVACNGGPAHQERAVPTTQEMITDNQQAMRMEARDIQLYVERHALRTTITGTGVHFRSLRDSAGPNARPEDLVTVNYRMELLDGTECYSSEPGEPESFRVEHDEVESGLHEAVQRMSVGDSALIIIPSHRAFGLVGDMAKVPMRSTLVYRLGLVRVATSKP